MIKLRVQKKIDKKEDLTIKESIMISLILLATNPNSNCSIWNPNS